MAYKSKYFPKNTSKYDGDPRKIFCRSLWERGVCKWLDFNPQVTKWGSEQIPVPYVCRSDGKRHRYYIDFHFQYRREAPIVSGGSKTQEANSGS